LRKRQITSDIINNKAIKSEERMTESSQSATPSTANTVVDLSQPREDFKRIQPPGMAQKERSLMAKVYCEGITQRYQACLDANGFDYAKCKREEMHHYHCVPNAYVLSSFHEWSIFVCRFY
jgi:hypothetical protein